MAANHVADLTIDEFKSLIRAVVREVLLEIEETDPDEQLTLKPEVAEYLRTAMQEDRRGTPASEVIRELGLEEWIPATSNL